MENELKRYTKNLSVMVVEDTKIFLHILKNILSPFFSDIITAKDGSEAFKKYLSFYDTNHRYIDIVITDIVMPKVDGLELSKMIFKSNNKQEIIAISGLSDTDVLIQLLNIGVHKFVTKPIKEELLLSVVYTISKKIFMLHIQEEEQKEIQEHNKILQEKELAQEKHLKEIYSALNESNIIARADKKGHIIYVNEQFCKITGYTKDELIGKNFKILKNNQFISSYYERLWRTITAKKSYKNIFKNKRKDGSYYYVQQVIKPLLDVNGEIKEYISIANDMTQIFDSLEKQKDTQRERDAFFRNIGHEMRTPLNAIIGITPLIQKKVKDDEKLSNMAKIIHDNAHNMHKLIERLLDIQQLQSNKLILNKSIFNPIDVIESLFTNMKRLALGKEQSFRYMIDKINMPEKLIGDSTRMIEVIEAIIDNAIKFTPNGGIIVCKVLFKEETNSIKISIKDNGIGIDQKDFRKIFEASQLDGSISRKHEGAGLGLMVVANLLKLLKGHIRMISEPNNGSTFFIEIPFET